MPEAKFYYKHKNTPIPNQPTSIGVVALIEKENKLLLERRTYSNRWALIGGAIKSDESLLDGLYREVMEETGLSICSYDLFGTFSDPSRVAAFPDGNIKRIITIAYKVQVEPFEHLRCSDESLELRFVDFSQDNSLYIAETHLQIIEHYKSSSSLVLD